MEVWTAAAHGRGKRRLRREGKYKNINRKNMSTMLQLKQRSILVRNDRYRVVLEYS